MSESEELNAGWVAMLCGQEGFRPTVHVTLTFDQVKHGHVSKETALRYWNILRRILNCEMGGKAFERKWGHSYFSYLVGVEYHQLGGAHMHVALDQRVSWATVHEWWEKHCGYAWVRPIRGDSEEVVAYVLKYVVKDDSAPTWFLQKEPRDVVMEAGRWQVVRSARPAVPVKGALARVP